MYLCCQYRRHNLDLSYYPHLLSLELAAAWFEYLEGFLTRSERRSTVLIGDPGIVYTVRYRGAESHRPVTPWDQIPSLAQLKELVERITRQKYTVCIIQRYPHGGVGIGPHRDKEMVPGTRICGLSLGASRHLEFTPQDVNLDNPSLPAQFEPLRLKLGPGSLYVMHPPTNQKWRHSILKESKKIGPRISLTFRDYAE
jgi:alkylated DNA repair dioxygenase AlkB